MVLNQKSLKGGTLHEVLFEVEKADCKRNLVVLALFYMILKTSLCVQHFCSFAVILFIVNLLSTAEKYCHMTKFEKWPL